MKKYLIKMIWLNKIITIIKKNRFTLVMTDDFKKRKVNREERYIRFLKEENQENKNEKNNLKINENNIKFLLKEFQINYEQKDEDDLEDFHNNEKYDDNI